MNNPNKLELLNELNKSKRFYYFEEKDYENIEKKLWFSTKLGLFTGASYSLITLFETLKPKTNERIFATSLRYPLLFTGCTLTYTATQCAIANIRKKDDPYNHLFAGLASGGFVGYASRCAAKGLIAATIFATIGTIMKFDYKERGFSLFDLDNSNKVVNDVWLSKWSDMTFGYQKTDPGRRAIK